jgi:hypothetical protein
MCGVHAWPHYISMEMDLRDTISQKQNSRTLTVKPAPVIIFTITPNIVVK